jgi:gas vesicle protein
MFIERGDSGFTAGMITGAMVGAGLALLFAPKAGADLRGELGESMASMRDALGRHYRALAERAGVELENIESHIDRAAASVESSAREVMEDARRRSPSTLG